MKIYISGAITDNPHFKEQFEAAEKRLKAKGHDVINPARNQGYTYKEYIDTGLFELMHCEAIYLLKGYDQSTGATLEHDYARTVGLEIMREEDEIDSLAAWAGDDVVTALIHTADKKIRQLVKKAAETPERNMVTFNPIVIKPEREALLSSLGKTAERQKASSRELLNYLNYLETVGVDGKDGVVILAHIKELKSLVLKNAPRKIFTGCGFPSCPVCGSDVDEDDEYCRQCGQHLD